MSFLEYTYIGVCETIAKYQLQNLIDHQGVKVGPTNAFQYILCNFSSMTNLNRIVSVDFVQSCLQAVVTSKFNSLFPTVNYQEYPENR